MNDETPGDAALISAVRRLASEARQAAAVVPLDSPDHEFYAGVQFAADRRLQAGLAAIEPQDLDRRSEPFRDGYLTAAAMIGSAGSGTTAVHLPLPTFRSPDA